jgi:DNA repair protein RadC
MFIDNSDDLIKAAIAVLEERVRYKVEDVIARPEDVRNLIKLKLSGLEHEEFHVIWLTTQNQVIEIQKVFRGTISQASVYPRELAKEGLKRNAASCILVHNHPSGLVEPSSADINLTNELKKTMNLVDIRIVDHFVVGGAELYSFAEKGLL